MLRLQKSNTALSPDLAESFVPVTDSWNSSEPNPETVQETTMEDRVEKKENPEPEEKEKRTKNAERIIKRVIRLAMAFLCLFLAMWLLLPVSVGIVRIETFWPMLPIVLVFTAAVFPKFWRKLFRARFRAVTWMVCLITAIGTVFSSLVMLWMWVAATYTPYDNATVIVLGCQVNGTEPSRMLADRINAAAQYLKENPSSQCIASGGRGENEQISEAQCIYNELVKKGISPSRIYLESQSRNTSENLAFSAQVIRENSLSKKTVIVSDRFHLLRAQFYADKAGLDASPLGCSTWFPLRFSYWAREVLAVTRYFIFGI